MSDSAAYDSAAGFLIQCAAGIRAPRSAGLPAGGSRSSVLARSRLGARRAPRAAAKAGKLGASRRRTLPPSRSSPPEGALARQHRSWTDKVAAAHALGRHGGEAWEAAGLLAQREACERGGRCGRHAGTSSGTACTPTADWLGACSLAQCMHTRDRERALAGHGGNVCPRLLYRRHSAGIGREQAALPCAQRLPLGARAHALRLG